MILILTKPYDEHADLVIEALQKRGAHCVRFETADFPCRAGMTICSGKPGEQEILRVNGSQIDLNKVETVWFRRPEKPKISQDLSTEDQDFARVESEHALQGLWHRLKDRFWVNPIVNDRVAHYKPLQLKLAKQIGFEIPRTLITNDPNEVLPFFNACGGEMIYKMLTNYTRPFPGGVRATYTTKLSAQDLQTKCHEIAYAPCLFQEYVPKKVEFRVTVIGREIFVAEIDSQGDEGSRHDWRRHDAQKLPHRASALPYSVQDMIQRFMQELGLVFGCIDFILTPDDRLVFLEINPSGQWYWIEQLTGMPLVDHFVELLLGGNISNRCSTENAETRLPVS